MSVSWFKSFISLEFHIIIMDKKLKNSNYSFKNLSGSKPPKTNKVRNSNTRTAKHLDSTLDHKSSYLSKLKSSLPQKSHRDMIKSVIPVDTHHLDPEDEHGKHYTSNLQINDLFHFSHSQKTITIKELKQGKGKNSNLNQVNKKKRYIKTNKVNNKCESQYKQEVKASFTTRKASCAQSAFTKIMKKTQKLLKLYQNRQMEWKKQKLSLLQELLQLKSRAGGRAMATSASIYFNKKECLI